MRIQKCISLALAGLALVACEKSQEQDQGKTAFKTALTQDPLDYEIYDPGVSDEYAEFKDGIVAVFNDANPGSLTAVNRAIWFYEGGLSGLLLPDDPYNDFDSLVLVSRDVNFTLDDGKIVDGDLVTEFTTDYNAILDQLNNESSYTYAGTDFRFSSIDATVLSGEVVHAYFVNASYNPWSSGTVPSATNSCYGGSMGTNCTPGGMGAWRVVAQNARATLPMQNSNPRVNVMEFRSFQNSHSSYIPGDFLFGKANSLHHMPPSNNSTACLTPGQIDDYAQGLVDALDNALVKKYFWDHLKWLILVNEPTQFGSKAHWEFAGAFGHNMHVGSNDRLSDVDLGIN